MMMCLSKILSHVWFEKIFHKRIKAFLKKDYGAAIMQRSPRLVIDPSTIDNHVCFVVR